MQHDYEMDYKVEIQYNKFVDKLYDLRLDQVNVNRPWNKFQGL